MKKLIVANWKMNGDHAGLSAWASAIRPPATSTLVLCPPLPYLSAARAVLPDSVWLGAQQLSIHSGMGAHTGEVSADMLVDNGCQLVLVGHSERRADHGENDAVCAVKIRHASDAGLRPLLCIGENEEGLGVEAALAILQQQLENALVQADDSLWQQLIIAYEPVWAIGSRKTPAVDRVGAIQQRLRQYLIGKTTLFGDKIPILYGGSVTPDNAQAFVRAASVDGFLVGGASLDAKKITAICNLTE